MSTHEENREQADIDKRDASIDARSEEQKEIDARSEALRGNIEKQRAMLLQDYQIDFVQGTVNAVKQWSEDTKKNGLIPTTDLFVEEMEKYLKRLRSPFENQAEEDVELERVRVAREEELSNH